MNRTKISTFKLNQILRDHDNTFSAFIWGNYQKTIVVTSGYLNWWPAIKEYVFIKPVTDYVAQYMGNVQGLGIWCVKI